MLGLDYDGDLSTGVEMKRTTHKQAEQRRRDSLKHCFEELKKVLPTLPEKNPSKVYLLKKSFDFIVHLKAKEQESEAVIAKLTAEIMALREGRDGSLESHSRSNSEAALDQAGDDGAPSAPEARVDAERMDTE
ncbi:hypothetical protein HK101_006827, partial [Irineochytrium annulatum]